jgi:hypothetical protein
MPTPEYLKQFGITFHFLEKAFQPERHHYAAECLASGLLECGYPLYSNMDHPLFRRRGLGDYKDGALVFVATEASCSPDAMEAIRRFEARNKFILSMADTNSSSLIPPESVPSLMAHENRFLSFTGLRSPWAFGLSNARIAASGVAPSFSSRRRVILRNFRPSLNQGVRDALDMALLPLLEKRFEIDWAIDKGSHFERLRNSVACLAYGGNFSHNMSRNEFLAERPFLREFARRAAYLREPLIVRWDSWRMWESFASGCLTFQLDFEKYGMTLPVNPTPWEHYIPVDLADLPGTVEKFLALEPKWADIAEAGRRWAIGNYAPRPVAERFIALVGRYYGQG